MNNNTYNGWANYETWNVSLWLNNTETLYSGMVDAIRYGARTYNAVLTYLRATDAIDEPQTPDEVAWDAAELDTAELDAMIVELAEDLAN